VVNGNKIWIAGFQSANRHLQSGIL
jgi:hypothetical protein